MTVEVAAPDALEALGWSPAWAEAFAQAGKLEDVDPGRVIGAHRGVLVVGTGAGEVRAEVAGRLRHFAGGGAMPAVGDWVAVRSHAGGAATVTDILPRVSSFGRRAAGDKDEEQVIAANIDLVFLVTSLNANLNLRRIERYLTMAWESGAQPMVVLSKADLSDDVDARVAEVEEVALGVPVLPVSVVTGAGVAELQAALLPNRTGAFLGSSGVGKSSLVNALLGSERQMVAKIRDDDRGRHTTTTRDLLRLPGGGVVMDTPGLRTVQLWESEDGIGRTFGDVEELAPSCRFRDCRHLVEPGCAVRGAVERGLLAPDRYAAYHKLHRELEALEARTDARLRAERARSYKLIAKSVRKAPQR